MPIRPTPSKLATAIQISLVGLGVCQSASAATIIVTSGGDSNLSDCTLREALTSINTGAEVGGCGNSSADDFGTNDSVIIPSNLTGDTIALASGALIISEDVTIDGGADGLTVDAGDQSRAFNINSATVTMDSFTIINGNAGFLYYGGGIYARQSDITLNNCELSGNYAQKGGGGILANFSSLTVNSSDISSNQARQGGGIFIRGSANIASLSLNNSTVTNNVATGQYGGGGIRSEQYVNASVTNSTFSNNSATMYDGGAISALDSKLSISANSVFSNNVSGKDGGAIFATGGGFYDYSLLDIENSSFSYNSADSTGGAIASRGAFDTTIDTTSVSNNFSAFAGGIWNSNNGTLLISDSEISQNVASNTAGGVSISSSTATLNQVSVSNNTAGTGAGGGLQLSGNSASIDIIASTINHNTANTFGGGLSVSSNTQATATNSTFSTNQAGDTGGGVFVGSSSMTFINSTLSDNSALEANNFGGGGLYSLSSVVSISNTIIANSPAGMDCRGAASAVSTDTQSIIEQDSCSTSAIAIDPQLLALADNGGPTFTHALSETSPARDTGDNTSCQPVDQRDELRDDGACDVGAFEFKVGDEVEEDEETFYVIPLPGGKTAVIPL